MFVVDMCFKMAPGSHVTLGLCSSRPHKAKSWINHSTFKRGFAPTSSLSRRSTSKWNTMEWMHQGATRLTLAVLPFAGSGSLLDETGAVNLMNTRTTEVVCVFVLRSLELLGYGTVFIFFLGAHTVRSPPPEASSQPPVSLSLPGLLLLPPVSLLHLLLPQVWW